jgi:MFS transporter, ACS family, glucarate transporter
VFLVCGSMAQSTVVATLVLAGGAGAIYLSQSSFWSAASDFAGSHTGVVSGVMNMACQIGGALTASLTPWIAAQLGWNAAFVAAAAVALLGAAAWVCVNPERPLVRERATLQPAQSR